MARARTARRPPHAPPEDESQEAPEPEAGESKPKAATKAAKAGIASKTEAVRRALADGFDGPQEGTAYIRKEFGIEIAPQHFSAVKSQIKKREGSAAPKGKPGRKPKQPAASDGYLAPPKAPADGGPDLLDSLESLKPLIAQYGAERVKRMVDLLG
jgi:hypothetical protein